MPANITSSRRGASRDVGGRLENDPITAHPVITRRHATGGDVCAVRSPRVNIFSPAKNQLPIPTVPPHPSNAVPLPQHKYLNSVR